MRWLEEGWCSAEFSTEAVFHDKLASTCLQPMDAWRDRSLPDLTITPAPHVLHGCWNTLQSQGASVLNGTAPKTWVSQSNSPELAVQGPPSPGSRKTATRLQALLLRTL